MTVGSRRLAARCRESFVTDPSALTGFTEPGAPDPLSAAETGEEEGAVQENLDAPAAT